MFYLFWSIYMYEYLARQTFKEYLLALNKRYIICNITKEKTHKIANECVSCVREVLKGE